MHPTRVTSSAANIDIEGDTQQSTHTGDERERMKGNGVTPVVKVSLLRSCRSALHFLLLQQLMPENIALPDNDNDKEDYADKEQEDLRR